MAIEQEARPYVRITGQGKPEVKSPPSSPPGSPSDIPPQLQPVVEQTEQGGIPDDVILVRNAVAMLDEQGYNERGAVIDGKIIPYGSFMVKLGSGREVTPMNRNELVTALVEEQKYGYRVAGSYYGLQGYSPEKTPEGGIVYVKPVEQTSQPPVEQQPDGHPLRGVSQGIADLLGVSRLQSQEMYVMPDTMGDPLYRQKLYQAGIVEVGPSEQQIAVGLMSIPQGAFFASGFKAVPEAAVRVLPFISQSTVKAATAAGLIQAGAVMGVLAVKDIVQSPSDSMREFQLFVMGGQIAAALSVSGVRFSQISQRARAAAGNLISRIPRQTELTYFKETGFTTVRNVYTILGRDVRSPFYRAAVGRSGLDFMAGPPGAMPEPTGLAQSSVWRPTIPRAVSIIHSGGLSYVEPLVSSRWQPLTGIPEPYVRTGMELGFLQPKPSVRPVPGSLIEYDPMVLAEDPRVTEIKDTLGMLSVRWQPRTGIMPPVEKAPGVVPVEPGPSPFDVVFKSPVAPVRVTRVGLDAEGNLTARKYGLTEAVSKRWQPLSGVYAPPIRTGRELSTTVWPKPTGYIPPGPLGFYEGMPLSMASLLESGLSKDMEGLIRFKPLSKGKRVFTLGDIVKVSDKPVSGGQIQKDGTVTILEPPETVLEPPVTEQTTDVVMDMYTESEVAVSSKSRGFYEELQQPSLSRQASSSVSLSVFPPLYGSRQNQVSLSDVLSVQSQRQRDKQERAVVSLSGVLSGFAQVSLSMSLQDSDMMQEMDTQFVSLSPEVVVIDVDRVVVDRVRPVQPGKPKVPKPFVPVTMDRGDYGGVEDVAPVSFIVGLRGRQYVDGRRVGDSKYRKASKPLSYDDALSYGMDVVDKSAKASFILIPSGEKAKRLSKDVAHWSENIGDFTQNKKGAWVELPRHRIDSPGELREITMRGIAARRRG